MMSKSTIVNLSTSEVVQHEDFQVVKSGEYPHDCFLRNPNKKPQLEVPITDQPIENLVRKLKGMSLDLYPLKLAKAILYKYFKEVEQILEEDWVSAGLTIGKAGFKVSPFSCYEVTEVKTELDGDTSLSSIDVDPYVGGLLVIYRLNQLPTGVSTTDIVSRFTQRYQGLFATRLPFAFSNVQQVLSYWDTDLNFRKIIAGVDLFLEKFPNHPKGKFKFGTVTSFKQLMDITPWLWETPIKIDAWRIIKRPLSLRTESLGCFLYMSDMGLVTRSIYSASLNPALHVFCQTIYCVTANPRGINARMLFPSQVKAVVRNGLMVAFTLDKTTSRGIEIVPEDKRDEYAEFNRYVTSMRDQLYVLDENEDEGSEISEFEMPKNRDPKSRFTFFETIEQKTPPSYKLFLENVKNNRRNSRANSVGKFIFDLIFFFDVIVMLVLNI